MIGYKEGSKCLLFSEYPTSYVKAIRKAYATAFQTKNLKFAVPKLNKVIDNLINIVESRRENGPIDMKPLLVNLTLDTIGEVAFESNLGGLDGSRELYALMQRTSEIMRRRLLNPLLRIYVRCFPNSKEAQRHNAISDGLTAEWDQVTAEILKRDDPSSDEEPLWSVLRNMKDPDTNEQITYDSLRAELATLVISGMDTAGHQLGWIIGLLASHPHVVDSLLEELGTHGLDGPNAKEITFEDLGELTYLTAIIKEGMRLAYVLHASFLRSVPKDMSIFGYRIPKDTVILCVGSRAMHSEEMWGDPHVFRPERWLSGEDMSDKYSLGFSVGPRDCIGQRLAMLEMRLVLIRLFTQYKFTLEGSWEDLHNSAKDSFLIEASNGVQVHITPRS